MTRAEQAAAAMWIVGRDLEAEDIPAPTIAWVEDGVKVSFSDGSTHWTSMALEESDAEVLERVADMVHDYLLEEMWSLGRRSNWPRCPTHPHSHPLRVTRIGDEVFWACPGGSEFRIPVGSLGGSPAGR